jgi:putative MATE family efflux protein
MIGETLSGEFSTMFSNKDLRRLLIPLVIDQVLMFLIGFVDTVMVSNVSAASLSAVSLVDSINTLVLFLLAALATGGTIVCSQYLGLGDRKEAKNASRQLIVSIFILSTLMAALCVLFRGVLLRGIFGSVDGDVMSAAQIYFLITAISYPFIALNDASAALFRAAGNSRLPMLVSLGANIIHIAVNAVLIFGLRLGVEGAAISTLLSRMLGALVMLLFQRRPGQAITLDNIRAYRPDKRLIRMILFVGIPAGIENCLFQLGKLLVQSAVSTLGTRAIAVQALTSTMEGLQSMPSVAIGLGLLTVAGYCMGAGRPDEARRYIIKLTKLSAAVLAACCGIVFVLTKPITGLAGMDAGSTEMTLRLMAFISVFKVFLWPFAFTPANGMRAAGDVRYTMLVSTVSMWVLRVGLCYVLIRGVGMGIEGVWIAWLSDWLCRAVFFLVRFLNGKWMEKKVLV